MNNVQVNQRSGEVSKRRILDAAKYIFSTQGYRNANMRLIARRAGISVGGIYIHFKNKEDLFLSVIKEKMEAFLSELLKLKEEKKDAPELFKDIIKSVMEHAEKSRDLIFIFTNMEKAKEGKKLGKRFSEQIIGIIGEVIRKGIKDQVFTQIKEKEAASVINSTLLGYIISVIVEKRSPFKEEICSELFLNGLLKR